MKSEQTELDTGIGQAANQTIEPDGFGGDEPVQGKSHYRFFPFCAVLGQDTAKRALAICLVNPGTGGVLLSGQKGTAKSTLVRSLGAATGTRIAELPLNTTSDRLVGSIDLGEALKKGRRAFEPGILNDANGGILYIDEVNLLTPHLTQIVSTVASSGVNVVEREGISLSHPARFVLMASMNPEEGTLGPQILDRFGLFVNLAGETKEDDRVEIMRRRLAYEADPKGFCEQWEGEERALADQIATARQRLEGVKITENALTLAASLASQAGCDGHRAEIVLVEAARAIAALGGRYSVRPEDIREAAQYVLIHRTRSLSQQAPPPPPPPPQPPQLEDEQDQPPPNPPEPEEPELPVEQTEEDFQDPDPPDQPQEPEPEGDQGEEEEQDPPNETPPAPNVPDEPFEEMQEPGEVFELKRWDDPRRTRKERPGSGKRMSALSSSRSGRTFSFRTPRSREDDDLAFDATIRAGAPYQASRRAESPSDLALVLERGDFRVRVREKRVGSTILFVVDASASIGANRRMSAVKGAILSLLDASYRKRDKVGLIAFQNRDASVVLDITRSVDLAEKRLRQLPCSGRTPLAAGLESALATLHTARLKDPDALLTMVLVTDGRANAGMTQKPFDEALALASRIRAAGVNSIVIDCEYGFVRLCLAEQLAATLGGTCVRLETLASEGIALAVNALKR